MNKFTEYEASFITPQKTLLSKFNNLLTYLRKNPTINVFEYNGTLSNSYMQISDLNINEYDVELGDLIIDKNCNYAFVSTIGAETFTVGDITSFKGDKGDKGNKGDKGDTGSTYTPILNQTEIVVDTEENTLNDNSFTRFDSGALNYSIDIEDVANAVFECYTELEETISITLSSTGYRYVVLKNIDNNTITTSITKSLPIFTGTGGTVKGVVSNSYVYMEVTNEL